jgi:hypothetical protein
MRGATGAEREGFIHRPKPLKGLKLLSTLGTFRINRYESRIPFFKSPSGEPTVSDIRGAVNINLSIATGRDDNSIYLPAPKP